MEEIRTIEDLLALLACVRGWPVMGQPLFFACFQGVLSALDAPIPYLEGENLR